MKNKRKNVIMRTSFIFELEDNLDSMMEDYEVSSKKELLERLEKISKCHNDDPSSAFKDIHCVKEPTVKIEIIEK